MKNLSKTNELRKIFQDIYQINNKLKDNNFNYQILNTLKNNIEQNINQDKKVDSYIEIFKNKYLQKKTKLMDYVDDYLKKKEEKEKEMKEKESVFSEDLKTEDINKENNYEYSNEIDGPS